MNHFESNKLKIAYAYGGFIYLPLFLAYHRNFLDENKFELINASTDSDAVDMVTNTAKIRPAVDVAICDPHLSQWESKVNQMDNDFEAIVIGKLIDPPPLWLISESADIVPAQKDLREFRGKIELIRSYEQGTTAFIFAQELKSKADIRSNIIQVGFDQEFQASAANQEAILTANILVVHEYASQGKSNIVYNWSKQENLKKCAFTGIITNTKASIYKFAELSYFMKAIQCAIHAIYHDPLNLVVDDCMSLFKAKIINENMLKNSDVDHIRDILKRAIIDIREKQFYPTDLSFNEESWTEFGQIRSNLFNSEQLNYEKFCCPYISGCVNGLSPVIFESKTTSTNNSVAKRKIKPVFRKHYYWSSTICGAILFIASSYFYQYSIIPRWKYAILIILIGFYVIFTGINHKNLKLDDESSFNSILGVIVSLVAIIIGVFLTLNLQ